MSVTKMFYLYCDFPEIMYLHLVHNYEGLKENRRGGGVELGLNWIIIYSVTGLATRK
jgi:hypothetical protein